MHTSHIIWHVPCCIKHGTAPKQQRMRTRCQRILYFACNPQTTPSTCLHYEKESTSHLWGSHSCIHQLPQPFQGELPQYPSILGRHSSIKKHTWARSMLPSGPHQARPQSLPWARSRARASMDAASCQWAPTGLSWRLHGSWMYVRGWLYPHVIQHSSKCKQCILPGSADCM